MSCEYSCSVFLWYYRNDAHQYRSHFYDAPVKFSGGAPDWYRAKYSSISPVRQLAYIDVYIIDQPAFDGNGEEIKEEGHMEQVLL